jgi:hypothetical protein
MTAMMTGALYGRDLLEAQGNEVALNQPRQHARLEESQAPEAIAPEAITF